MFYSMLSTQELPPARLTALSIIAMEPDIGQTTLSQRLGITGPSVLKMVDVSPPPRSIHHFNRKN